MLNRMQVKRHRVFKFISLLGLGLCLATQSLGTSCSKGVIKKDLEPKGTWACDKESDEAMLRKDYEASIPLHHRFLQKDPANGLALYHLGYAYGQLGDHLKEVSYYEKAITVGFKRDHIFFNLAMAFGELNQTENAIRAFKEALHIDPRHLDARLHLSILYAEIGEARKACEQLHTILEMDPTNEEARRFLDSLERE